MFVMPRRRSVVRLVRRIAKRHPEFESPMTLDAVMAVCARERIVVRDVVLPRRERARLMSGSVARSIHVARGLPRSDRLLALLHELAHYFVGDVGETCVVQDSDNDWNPTEEFADVFAWYCCDVTARALLNRRVGGF